MAPWWRTIRSSGHTNSKCYPCTVEVFSDNEDEGRIYHGSSTTKDDATGTWTYSGAVTGPSITATITDGSNDTSEFSVPVAFSSGPTPTPPAAVGGIAELPDFAGASADEAGAPAEGSGWSAAAYAALAGGVATVVLTLGAGA